jgi:FMN phosphatase YigB (HAD superfamily)
MEPIRLHPVAGIVMDLDNTLLRTELIPESVVEPAVAAIVQRRGTGGASEHWRLALRDALYTRAFDEAARDMGLTDEETRAGFESFASVTLPPDLDLVLFADARGALDELQTLRQRGLRSALVTRGFATFQTSKVKRLGLEPLFERFLIDAIDDPHAPRFPQIIRGLLSDWKFSPDQMLVIDDDDRKLSQASGCGTQTVLVDRASSSESSNELRWTRVSDLQELMRALSDAFV